MKKQLLAFAFLVAGMGLVAQVPRMSLYEEFTGETCPPCAATNPGLDILLLSGTNPSKVIPIKWQVPIPSAPSALWSLYQTNKLEINWRYSQYGYGVNSAPTGRMDGQNLTAFGITGSSADHPANLTTTAINNAAAVTTPFAINMVRAWDSNYTTVTLTVNISSMGNFTAVGNLVCRVVLIENEIHFPVQPGTNGEKDFNWVVRKSYPDIQNGTTMLPNWTNGQTQQIVLTCQLPSYINDKSQVAFVAFIQDDGDRKVMQAAKSTTQPVANDAKADLTLSSYVCGGNFVPKLNIFNNGNNAITALDITPKLDATVGSVINWTGNLAAGASTLVTLSSVALTTGAHTYSYMITNVSGSDFNPNNNSISKKIVGLAAADLSPVTEDFVTTFPPANWSLYSGNSTAAWVKSTSAGGFGLSTESAKMDFFTIAAGSVVELVVKPLDLYGTDTPTLTFDVAYAQYGAAYDDRLEVFASSDCGVNWTSVYDKSGTILKTRAPITSAFVPGANDWRTETVTLPGFNTSQNVLVKFTATSDFGNNLYVDNVNLKQESPTVPSHVGINAVNNVNMGVSIFPNPSNGETTLEILTNSPSAAKISVVNVLGQTVYSQSANLNSGSNNVQLNVSEFAPGVYNVMIDSKNGSVVKKLNVTK
ncbi:MAG: T9SS type A sorting domain-containing protein [Bacteroidota bacterium]